MGTCCSAGGRRDVHSRSAHCQGHHSLYVQPEVSQQSHTAYTVVYRPPQLNRRLEPGEARPRFWINPGPGSQEPAVVSVAWCELCHPHHFNMPRLSNTKRSKGRPSNNKAERQRNTDDVMEGGVGSKVDDVMMAGDNDMVVKVYPAFLVPYTNKTLRLRLVFTDAKVRQMIGEHGHLKHDTDSEPMQETSHLVRTVHSLRIQLGYSSRVRGLPEVSVEENHGGTKRLKKVRYRQMPVRWIDLDHRQPNVTIVGEAFQLSLEPPCPDLTPEDFPDGNGEIPAVLGSYRRTLDTSPERQLEFSVRLFHWYNQTGPSQCNNDHSSCLNT
ncbi:uncharacterized protein LOC101851649 [Aplysia californica]|uniref:Uncharacterized protein LOC101851649 n=1 Tax=Aplysia californica TaxID=6500 RepID=A0ABM1A2B4_APLCA|nr:uncharacterized protein LOC101851649 [Aplysia californica]